MPDLIPSPPPFAGPPGSTTEAPHPYGNVPGAIEGAYNETARGLKEAGAGLMDVATPLAERQAASDLENQKIMLGPDGKPQIINQAHSFAFGAAGEAAGRVIQAGTVAQAGALIDQGATDIHMKHLGDPAGQATANAAFAAGFKGLTGNPMLDNAIGNRALETTTQHYDSNVESTTRLAVEKGANDIAAHIETETEYLGALARAGVPETDPDWIKHSGALNAAYDEQQSNILSKKSPTQVAVDRGQTALRFTGERLIGALPKVIDAEGMIGAKAKVDEMLANPGIEPRTRQALRIESGRILAEAQPKWQEDNRNYDQGVAGAERDIASGRLKVDDPTVAQMRQYGSDHHMERAPDFEAWIYQHHLTSNLAPATPDQRNTVMGIPHTPTPGVNVAPPDATVQPAGFTPQGGFDLQSYKNRTSQIEGSGSDNPPDSPTGAFGKYQFMPSTAAKYGVVKGGDQEAGMDRLTAANRADLQQGLGRDATPAETYLAHQQGSAGALALINHPNARAGDLVGDKAIRVNGGDPNAPASQFVKQWEAKFNGTTSSIASQRAAAGQPQFTPEEVKKYGPALFASAFQKENQDPAEKLSYFNAKISMMESGLKVGSIPSQEDIADIYRTMGDNQNDPRYQERFANWDGLLKATMAQSMPPAQQQALLGGALAAANAPGADMMTKGMAAGYNRATAEWDKQWKDAPVSMASKFIGTPVTPMDMTSSQGMAQSIAQRSAAASAVLARRGEAVSVFEGDDLGQVKGVLQNGTIQQKQALLDGMSSIADPRVLNATMAKLGNDQAGGSFKVAASLMDQNQPQAAQDILEGQQILAQDKTYAPKESSFSGIRKGLGDALPSTDFGDEGSRGAVEAAVRAVYAKKSFQANDTSQEYNDDRFKESLSEVTGGVHDFRGSKVFGQRYGATDDDLDKATRSLNDGDFANARAPNGDSVPGNILNAGQNPGFWSLSGSWPSTSGDWRLESRGRPGDGSYYVYAGSGQKSYLRDATSGGKFILDLSNK